MLAQAGSSIDGDEALLSVIGFLEACVPRMVELIEAAAQGALKPETFEECLLVNDKLTNILSDVDKDPKERQPIVPAAAAAASATAGDANNLEDDMDKLAIGEPPAAAAAPLAAVAGGKTTGLDDADDPFSGGVDLLSPTPLSSDPFSAAPSAAALKSDDDDDFDAFFRDRTSAGGKQD